MTKNDSILSIALRELSLWRSNFIYVLAIVIFPLFSMIFFTSLMDEGVPTEMPVGIVDRDNTPTTHQITRLLDGMQTSKVVAHYATVNEARQAIQRNEVYGFMYFPEGTTRDLMASRQPRISFYYTMSTLAAGSLMMRDMKTTATLASVAVAKSTLTAKGVPDSQLMALLQPIALDLRALQNPWVNYNIYISTVFVPAVFMLFIFLITAYTFGMELKRNTARRLMEQAKGNIWAAIIGKLLPQTVVFTIVLFVHSIYIYGVLDFPHPGGIWPMLMLDVLTVLAGQGFGLFVFGLVPTLRMSMSICSLWGVLSFSLVGSAYPVPEMDGALQAAALLIPMRHVFMIYQSAIFNGYGLTTAWPYILALMGFIVLPVTVAWRLKKAMMTFEYEE